MLERAQTRALPLLNKSADLTPALNACCGACRTCITANAVTLTIGAVTGAAVYVARFVQRRVIS